MEKIRYNRGALHPVTAEKITPVEYNELAKVHGWELLEQWEVDLRTKLEAELEDGCYAIGGPGFWAYTGKGGKIDFEVELRRELRKWTPPPPIKQIPPINPIFNRVEIPKVGYKTTSSYEELKKKIEEFMFGIINEENT